MIEFGKKYTITFASEVAPFPITIEEILYFETWPPGTFYFEKREDFTQVERDLLQTFVGFQFIGTDAGCMPSVKMTIEVK